MTDSTAGSSSEPDDATDEIDDLLHRLATLPAVEVIEADTGGAHKATRLKLEDGTEVYVKSSEVFGLPQAGAMVRYEVAAYRICRMVGATLIPPTTFKVLPVSGNHRLYSVQLAVDGELRGDVSQLLDADVALAAALDLAVLQMDRLKRNWLVRYDDDGLARPVLIDHGFCFDYDTSDAPEHYDLTAPRSVFVEEAERRGLRLPMEVFAVLQEPTNAQSLLEVLTPEALANVLLRVATKSVA